MKKRTRFVILSVSLILIILLLLLLSGHSTVYSRYGDIDINSGDLRWQTYLFSLLIKEEIQETDFSREVRRLGIPVGEDRIWEHCIMITLIRRRGYQYGGTVVDLAELINILDFTDTSDQDRIAILHRTLTALRKGNCREISRLRQELYFNLMEGRKKEASGPTSNNHDNYRN